MAGGGRTSCGGGGGSTEIARVGESTVGSGGVFDAVGARGDARRDHEEDAFEEEAGEFFDYDRHELPRHMKDWYAPRGEEYGSFFDVNAPAAGQYDWKSEEHAGARDGEEGRVARAVVMQS